MFRIAKHVLEDYDFTVDRMDRREGVVSTLPLTGKSFFEFWRHDAATVSDSLESTLQTIYRTAEVRFIPSEQGGWTVEVGVSVARSDRFAPHITSASQAIGLYRLQRGSPRYRQRMQRRGEEENRVVQLENDPALAEEIRADILEMLEGLLESLPSASEARQATVRPSPAYFGAEKASCRELLAIASTSIRLGSE